MVQRIVRAAFSALILVLPAPALAQGDIIHEIRGGVLMHDVPFLSTNNIEGGVAFNAEIAFGPSFAVLGGRIRPVAGTSVASGGGASLFYVDARIEWELDRAFFALGLGPAIHTGNLHTTANGRKPLGSRVLFHPSVELGLRVTDTSRVSIYYEHASNAYLARPNSGLDNIGVRVSYRF